MKPHLQHSFNGLLLTVSCSPLINHLKLSGDSPGPAPPAVWPNAFIATNQPLGRGADTFVTVQKGDSQAGSLASQRVKPHSKGWGAPGDKVGAGSTCFWVADPPTRGVTLPGDRHNFTRQF